MEENKTIQPKPFKPNLMWLDTLKLIGNCKNLNQINSEWNQLCEKHFDELHRHYMSSFVEATKFGFKYEMVEGPSPGLLMKLRPNFGYILDVNKTIVSFRFGNRDFALKHIVPQTSTALEIEFFYQTIDKGIFEVISITYDVDKFPMENDDQYFYAPRSHFISDFPPLKALKSVHHLIGEPVWVGITKADFLEAEVEPKFYPEFAQTLLKKQKKIGYLQ